MRRADQYIVREDDDVLSRENAIHADIDMRLDEVEEAVEVARNGNRADLDLLIERYNSSVATLAARVDELLDLAQGSFSASLVSETAGRKWLTEERRQEIIAAVRGEVADGFDTLGELYTLIRGYATPTMLGEAIATLTNNAPAGRDTFAGVSAALDALTAGAPADLNTFKELADALAALKTTVTNLTPAGSTYLSASATQTFNDFQKDRLAANAGLSARYLKLDGGNSGQLGCRNRFVNGQFAVWQRGLSFTNKPGQYVADMVYHFYNGSGQGGTVDKFVDPDSLRPCLRVQVTTPADGTQTQNYLKFFIESVRTFAGKTIAVSFSAWKYGTGPNFTFPEFYCRQSFGTGGAPTAPLLIEALAPAPELLVTAAKQRFVFFFTVPALDGRALGTNGDDHLFFILSLPRSQNFKLMLEEFQAEEVASSARVATPFEFRSPGEYLANCQRYFEKSYSHDDAPGAATFGGALSQRAQAATTTLSFGTVRFAVPKRTLPAVTLLNPATGLSSAPVRDQTAAANLAGAVDYIGTRSFGAYVNAASVAAGNACATHWTADASY